MRCCPAYYRVVCSKEVRHTAQQHGDSCKHWQELPREVVEVCSIEYCFSVMGMLLELETLLHQSMYDCTCTWYSNENAILQDYFTSKAGDGCSLLHCLLRWVWTTAEQNVSIYMYFITSNVSAPLLSLGHLCPPSFHLLSPSLQWRRCVCATPTLSLFFPSQLATWSPLLTY